MWRERQGRNREQPLIREVTVVVNVAGKTRRENEGEEEK